MVKPLHHSFIDKILGRVPTTYTLTCMNAQCDYHEHAIVSTRFNDEPYSEGHLGIRKLTRVPRRCPKCGCKTLRKSPGPPFHY